MKYNKQFVIDFAAHAKGESGDLTELFDVFLDKYMKDPEEPEEGIHGQVLNAAIELCGITIDELSSGRRHGEIPTCKQMISKILCEMNCSEHSISDRLPMLGVRGTVHSQIMAAAKHEKSNKSFRLVLNQLREKFDLLK